MEKIPVLIVAALFIIPWFLPWEKWLLTDYNSKDSYNEGYHKALDSIKNSGKTAQQLYNQARGEEDNWDKGWKQACLDSGAKGYYESNECCERFKQGFLNSTKCQAE